MRHFRPYAVKRWRRPRRNLGPKVPSAGRAWPCWHTAKWDAPFTPPRSVVRNAAHMDSEFTWSEHIVVPVHRTPPDPRVLIEWRRWRPWGARVITVVDRPGRSPAVIGRWYDQRDVTPAPTKPQSPDPGRRHLAGGTNNKGHRASAGCAELRCRGSQSANRSTADGVGFRVASFASSTVRIAFHGAEPGAICDIV